MLWTQNEWNWTQKKRLGNTISNGQKNMPWTQNEYFERKEDLDANDH